MATAGLTDRLHQLKVNTKANKLKKKIIVNAINSNFTKKPGKKPQPIELDYPIQRPNFNLQTTSDPNPVAFKTWRPSEAAPSYNKLSILTQQESLPIIKAQFQATLNRQGSTTAAPETLLSEAELASKTNALLSELLKLSGADDLTVVTDVTNSNTPLTESTGK